MRAARFHGRCDLRIEEVDEPAPAAGEVKIRNAYVGICGSDLHVYFDPEHCGLDFSTPHPVTGSKPPQILGHEFSGTVVELGAGVDDIAVGDRVAVWPIYYCGVCAACRAGMVNICRSFGFHGLTSDGGGLAEYTTVAPGGRLVVVAVHGKDLDFDTTRLVFSERSITGSLAYLPADFDAVIAAMAAGSYDPAGWSEEAAMDDVVATFHRLREGAGTKVLIRV